MSQIYVYEIFGGDAYSDRIGFRDEAVLWFEPHNGCRWTDEKGVTHPATVVALKGHRSPKVLKVDPAGFAGSLSSCGDRPDG